MIKVEWVYWLCAAFFLAVSAIRLADRGDRLRIGSAVFWALLAFTFGYARSSLQKSAPPLVEGVAVLGLAALAGLGFPGRGSVDTTTEAERTTWAERFGNRLFLPALVIPVVAVIFAAVLVNVRVGGGPLLETGFATIIGLGVAAVCRTTRLSER